MGNILVSATNLHKSFRGLHAVDGVSLQIKAGEIYGLVGADGAGKTTTLRLLGGALLPDAGEALLDRYGYIGDFYGHFGDGCVHTRNDFDLESKEGIAKFRSYMTDAAHLVASYGGSFSGEHGDGQSRAELLPIMFGDELVGAFREFKEAWDPNWKMNPGKVVEPYRIDENLRLGETYRPKNPVTSFAFPADDGSFDQAVSRCVGVGLCRRESSGTMCPSWMVTREEKHSTRGRARLLSEMLVGEVLPNGWESEERLRAVDGSLVLHGSCLNAPPLLAGENPFVGSSSGGAGRATPTG